MNAVTLELTEDEIDALKELSTIGAGHAATALSQLVKSPIGITLPNISFLLASNVNSIIEDSDHTYVATMLNAFGDIGGKLVLIFELNKALTTVKGLLKPGGGFMFSVPAHKNLWDATDEYGGHLRRYEKEELHKKLNDTGFEIVEFFNYGYPIINLIKRLRDVIVKMRNPQDIKGEQNGGNDVTDIVFNGGRLLFNDITMLPFYILQKPFLNTDLGTAYLVLAKKRD